MATRWLINSTMLLAIAVAAATLVIGDWRIPELVQRDPKTETQPASRPKTRSANRRPSASQPTLPPWSLCAKSSD